MAPGEISGSLLVLFLYDVSDEIGLDDLRKKLGAPASLPAGANGVVIELVSVQREVVIAGDRLSIAT
ncbi:MAG: hypothetical protein C5B51_32390 [Terriglobia bacterium]|nr:MAG: hypothetical protein C5B51_32390 [Terriglobia bacterium]